MWWPFSNKSNKFKDVKPIVIMIGIPRFHILNDRVSDKLMSVLASKISKCILEAYETLEEYLDKPPIQIVIEYDKEDNSWFAARALLDHWRHASQQVTVLHSNTYWTKRKLVQLWRDHHTQDKAVLVFITEEEYAGRITARINNTVALALPRDENDMPRNVYWLSGLVAKS